MNIESAYRYCPGGYHPVHLDDKFHNGRYTVVNKLGHGTYAVVWLVYDSQIGRYAALKICVANLERSISRVFDEITVVKYLQHVRAQSSQSPDDDEGNNHVVQIFDVFTHKGPNGTHLCIVTEILGPNLADALFYMYREDPAPTGIAKRLGAQVAYGLRYLHKHGIVHGDLHVRNVLLYAPTIISSSQEHTEKMIRKPRRYIPHAWKADAPTSDLSLNPAPDPHIPQYLVLPCLEDSFIEICFADPASLHVKICDFGESFLAVPGSGSRIRPSHCPEVFASPEVFFENLLSPASDIWALAHLINYLFLRRFLFSEPAPFSRAVMVLKLGKFPEKWWAMWSGSANGSDTSSASSDMSDSSTASSGERWDWFDEDENWCSRKRKPGKGSGKWLMLPRQFPFEGEAEEDRAMVERILRKMTFYDVEKRATAAEVVELIPDRWMRDRPGEEGIDWPVMPDDDP
ncbi:kinase-like protein [Gymnopus androsaceus JB14]|uniref:non-specific serine/threonine protein kinase n=1 Tax=Gymnopus androsaceus JB14 TaxID=1447944 RepID=A0A6A4IK14_9AGAR|nr:kinase-like protein [Gymnopus androsaceus JB14]